ncbi:hypothetical protein LTR49_025821 [Elasticomyces elasticus]|nr:hypothetical protein LTR49_025821 [Elasticomyces elasticus]
MRAPQHNSGRSFPAWAPSGNGAATSSRTSSAGCYDARKLAPLFQDEWDMYAFRYRAKAGTSNHGWMRNILFSVSQQLVRTDLLFYFLHVLLHPDHPLRWISYPYETKYAHEATETNFQHLDLNVWQAAAAIRSGRRGDYPVASLVQSAVSFDNEDESSCTKIGRRHILENLSFSGEFQQETGLRFRHDVTRAGEVRMSDPHSLHGSTGPTEHDRRAVYAWLVPHDGENLLQNNTGSVAELSAAHATQSIRPPKYAGCPGGGLAAGVQLQLRSQLANTLVGRRSFEEPAVQLELRVLSVRTISRERFIMYHKGAIESYPLQTYASALLFSPTWSTIRRLFQHEVPKGITVKPAISRGWSACLQTLEGHSGKVNSVTFSRAGIGFRRWHCEDLGREQWPVPAHA